MHMLPSEETLLMTARILWRNVTAQLKNQPGNQNSLGGWLKNKGDIDIRLLSILCQYSWNLYSCNFSEKQLTWNLWNCMDSIILKEMRGSFFSSNWYIYVSWPLSIRESLVVKKNYVISLDTPILSAVFFPFCISTLFVFACFCFYCKVMFSNLINSFLNRKKHTVAAESLKWYVIRCVNHRQSVNTELLWVDVIHVFRKTHWSDI